MPRRRTRTVKVGALFLGHEHPIRVQSMTTTDTHDVAGTVAQIEALAAAGCEIVRVTVNHDRAADALPEIRRRCPLPLVADVHFTHRLALRAIAAGVDKVRLNPGNVGSLERVREVVRAAQDAGVSLRIGVNSGSVEKDLLEKHGYPKPACMVESALRHVEWLEECGFRDIVVSIKSTNVQWMIEGYRLWARSSDVPTHLGVTEAGLPGYGTLKSAIGIGSLLCDGIGDTIRVSLTGDKALEMHAAFDILKASGRRVTSPELIACPECGRIQIDLKKIVNEVKERIRDVKAPIQISILGCAVNGPGEAAEADIGIAGERGQGILFRKGVEIRRVKEAVMVDELEKEVRALAAERNGA